MNFCGKRRGIRPGCPGMRAVIQRVQEARVDIGGETRSAIGPGLLVFVAVETADSAEDIQWLCGKLVRLRIFNDAEGVMNLSVQDRGGDVLVVSQFTLFASTRKGNRPSYSRSAPPELAIPLYNAFVERLSGELQRPVQTGEFGADMQVSLVNDGPVTLLIDSRQRE